MRIRAELSFLTAAFVLAQLAGGCVERRLTVNTEPQGALVELNDEEVGVSPVTVSFNWYGDYRVRIRKEGYETLSTHRELPKPMHDDFPFDFFALLNPETKVDSYEWTFELQPRQEVDRAELIEKAQDMRNKLR